MSCTAPSPGITEVSGPITSRAISRELHQTAQPLTALQGLLELALLTPHTVEEYRSIIRQAMEESLRVSGCFDHVRELFQRSQLAVTSLPETQPNQEMYETQGIECVHV
jgi:hypothetical protein